MLFFLDSSFRMNGYLCDRKKSTNLLQLLGGRRRGREERERIEDSRFPPQTAWAQIGFDHVGDSKHRQMPVLPSFDPELSM